MRKRVIYCLALYGDGCDDGGPADITESTGGSAPVATDSIERTEVKTPPIAFMRTF